MQRLVCKLPNKQFSIDPYTEILGQKSTYLNINTGVPQGSILGPILFLIYVNDINNCSNLNILCFADDTTIYKSGSNIEDLICNVNIQLEFLYAWLCCNKLSLNINKTSYTIFRHQSNAHNNLNSSLLINHEVVKPSEESTKAGIAKFLGIYIIIIIITLFGPKNMEIHYAQ